MSWLLSGKNEDMIARFRELLRSREGIIKMPGTHDALSSLLARKAGFRSLYLSGAAFSASLGLPDLGIITLSELAVRTREITRASRLPLLVDVDTGHGGALHVARTVREMVEAGAAAIQIEDQESPKKCGHLDDKRLVSQEEMVQKVMAARRASDAVVIVARTDARASVGLSGAVERGKAYVRAGADIIFPEALRSEEEFRAFAEAVDCPLLANMTEFGRTPYYSARQFEEWGYRIVIYPVTSLRVAAKAIERVYRVIQEEGTQRGVLQDMQTREELYDLIRYAEHEKLAEGRRPYGQ